MKRVFAISILRILSMLYIVAYHCVCYYGIWDEVFPGAVRYSRIETFRFFCFLALCLFTFISGFLYGYNHSDNIFYSICKKFKRLMIPYFFWSVISFILFHQLFSLTDFLCGFWHLWYLLMLFIVFVMAITLRIHKRNMFFLLLLALAIGVASWTAKKYCPESVVDFFAWRRVLIFSPYFLSGLVVSKFNVLERIRRLPQSLNCLFFLVICFVLVVYNIRGGYPLSDAYIWIPISLLFIYLYIIAENAEYFFSDSTKSIIMGLDKNSMGVYLIHHILIFMVLLYCPNATVLMNTYPILCPLLLSVVVAFTSYAISNIMNKNKFSAILLGC